MRFQIKPQCLAGFAVFFLASAALLASTPPPGTVLPARLNSTLSSKKMRPGQVVTARIMQDVPLPDRSRIPQGSTLIGHVVSVTPAANGIGGLISLRFDALKVRRHTIPITAHLRAIASPIEVEQAQIPVSGPDRGTPDSAWTTVQIGGDTVYRGGGPVEGKTGEVGQPVHDGVLSLLSANPEAGCLGTSGAEGNLQALWVFSSDACGAYGLPGLAIAHAGRTNPVGEISFRSLKDDAKIPSGSGLLLRVDVAGNPHA
jgi:hypothetical protein